MTSHTRRGYTLIELMLVIVLASLTLGSIAALLQGVWRANRAMQSHGAMVRSIQRLATQFRDDVHAAVSVEPDGGTLALNLPDDKMAIYEMKQNAIERTVGSASQVVHRDEFDLPPHSKIAFEARLESDYRLVSLIVNYPLGAMKPEFAERRTLRIDAAIGIAPPKVALK